MVWLPLVSQVCYYMPAYKLEVFQIALKEYNPLHHERGFHSKLNSLVKDSLQFGYLLLSHYFKSSNFIMLHLVYDFEFVLGFCYLAGY